MNRFVPWGIRTWLFVTPTLAIVLFALVVLLTLQSFRHQESVLSDIQSGEVERLKAISTLSHRITRLHVELSVILGEAGETVDEEEAYNRTKPKLDELWSIESDLVDQPGRFVSSQTDASLFDDLVRAFQAYRSEAVSAVLMTTVEIENTERYQTAANAAYQLLSGHFATLTGNALGRTDSSMEEIKEGADTLARNLILVLVGSAVLSLTVAWIVSMLLSRDLSGAIRAMDGLARGDPPGEIPGIARRDEIGQMARAARVFEETLMRLHEEVSLHRRTEEALRAERNFVTAINDTVGALVVVLDRDGRIVRFNRACEELSGYRQDEVAGHTLWDSLALPGDADQMRRRIRSQITDDGPTLVETAWLTRGGSPRRISWAITALRDGQGRVEHLIGCGVDITERKVTEEKLRQAQKMEAVGQLTGGIAHDFNNLLAVVLGNLELLQERCRTDGGAQKLISPAMRAGLRGAELTQRLLAFARRQPLSPQVVDIDDLVAGMVSLFRRTFGEEIVIEPHGTDGLWPCRVDPGQLEDAILNLALNARDAMPGGGHLTIRTANVRATGSDMPASEAGDETHGGEYVLLEISDDGVGIPPELHQQVFEPFFTTKEVGKGSGLGLSMVYGFVKQSRGHVSVDSAQGRGTIFRIYLPRAEGRPDTASMPDPSPTEPDTHAERILVVEDDADVRRLAVSLLDALGYHVLAAADGPAALDLLRERQRVDLLFSDLVLSGGMNGPEIADAARAIKPDLKVLYMSGYAENAQDILPNDGSRGPLLDKPFRKADLAKAVRDVLGARAA